MYFDCRDVLANTKKWYESYDEKTMTLKVEVSHDDEEYEELKECLSDEAHKLINPNDGCVTFNMMFKVCPLCYGKGYYVNPSIDSHGISAEEWDNYWSHEEQDFYINGGYNIKCEECEGRRVVPEINTHYFTDALKEIKKLIEFNIKEEESYIKMYMMERKMGV